MRTVITLLSNRDRELYPDNCTSKFVNILPHHIYPRKNFNALYVRLLSACIPVARGGGDKLVWFFMNELEGSVLFQSERDHCLGQVQLEPDRANKNGVQFHEFRHTSFQKVSQIPLYRLNILLADGDSNQLQPVEDRETSITLEIMDEIESGDHFEVVGTSLPTDESQRLFPNNNLTDFRIPLPFEIMLDETWEVALLNMTIPPYLAWRKYWIFIHDEFIFVDVSTVRSARMAARAVADVVASSRIGRQYLMADVGRRGLATALLINRRPLAEDAGDPFEDEGGIELRISQDLMALMNPTGPRAHDDYLLHIPPRTLEILPLTTNPDEIIKLDHYDPLAMVYCDIVKPNIVGGELKPLLQALPMGQYIHADRAELFQPKNLLYHDTLFRKLSSIRIKIENSSGGDYPIQTQRDNDAISVTLKFRRKQTIDE